MLVIVGDVGLDRAKLYAKACEYYDIKPMRNVCIAKDNNKKPYFEGDTRLFISISHSNIVEVVAIDLCPVGIDIEYIKDRNYQIISNKCFGRVVESLQEFYELWTQKESAVKLTGEGLTYDNLTQSSCKKIYTKAINVKHNYVCQVSSYTQINRVDIINC